MSNHTKGTSVTMTGTIIPEEHPKLSSVQECRQFLATKLSTIEDDRLDGGMLYILEERRMHTKQIGTTNVTNSDGSVTKYKLPDFPKKLEYKSTTNRGEQSLYNTDLAYYKHTMFWNQEAIDWIQKKYSKALLDKEIDHGVLLLNLTAQEAFDHIKAKVKSEDVVQLEFKDIMKQHLNMTYTPNAYGAEGYFKHATKLQDDINRLDIGLKLPDGYIMACAMSDFKRSGHDKNQVAMIITKWKTKLAITGTGAIKDEDKFTCFQEHFNVGLKDLYCNDDTGTTDVANQAIDAKLSAIKERQAKQDENMLQLHNNQLAVRAESTSNVPPAEMIGEIIHQLKAKGLLQANASATPSNADATAIARAATLLQQAQGAVATQPAAPTSNATASSSNGAERPKDPANDTDWQQYKYWCYSCGVNLTHDSGNCPPNRCRRCHDANATNANPGTGANTKRNNLWELWFHPTAHTCHKTIRGKRVYIK